MERSQSQDTDGGGAIGEDSSAPLNEEYPSKDKASSIHSDKPKNRRRKRSNKGRFIDEITIDEVMRYSHLPSRLAAEQLGIGVTSLKRICRSHGIKEWIYKSDSSSQPQTHNLLSREIAGPEELPNTARSRHQETIISDQIAAEAFILQLDHDGLSTMTEILDQLCSVSTSLREKLGFSILNEGVLMTLLEKAGSKQTAGTLQHA